MLQLDLRLAILFSSFPPPHPPPPFFFCESHYMYDWQQLAGWFILLKILFCRLISDLVVVIVSATCGGIAFACAGQPVWHLLLLEPLMYFYSYHIASKDCFLLFWFLQVITGYLLAGSLIGPGGLSFVSEMVQVCHIHVLPELTVIFVPQFCFPMVFSSSSFSFLFSFFWVTEMNVKWSYIMNHFVTLLSPDTNWS